MAIQSARVKINRDAIRALLVSPEVTAELEKRGQAIADAAGEGVEMTSTRNRDRAVVFVKTETFEAKRAEAEDRTLTRALDAGR